MEPREWESYAETYYGSANLTRRPIDVTPTMRVMPYDGKPADIGQPDLKAGKGCLHIRLKPAKDT